MNKEKILIFFTFMFMILTFIGTGYAILHKEQANASYAVVPSVLGIIFCIFTIAEKIKKAKNNKSYK